MKKLFALLLALMMVFALAACGNNNTTDPDKDKPGVSQTDNQGGEENNGGENNNGGNTENYDLTTVAGYLAKFGYSESDFSFTKNFTRTKSTSTGSNGEVILVGIYVSEGMTSDEKNAWVNNFITLAKSKSDDGKVYKYHMFNGIEAEEYEPSYDGFMFVDYMAYRANGKVIVVDLSVPGGVDNDNPDDAMAFANIGFEFE